MTPTQIKILMMENGISQAEIARRLKIKRQVVNQVVNGRVTSKRVKRAIAKAVNKKLEDIWPNAA